MAKAASGSQAGQVVPRGAGSRQASGPPTGSQGALRRRPSKQPSTFNQPHTAVVAKVIDDSDLDGFDTVSPRLQRPLEEEEVAYGRV